jgi:putative nucleotidyltransferase with HDIG domain
MSTEKLAEKMEQIILARIAGDKLALPMLPAIANRCIAALRDANLTVKRLVAIMEQDPVIAARLLRLANSATYGAGGVRTLEAAVTRLGLAKLKTILFELSARQVFVSRDPRIAKATRSMWDHSLAVALVGRDLCALSSKAEEMDTAYLAGLLHDVGKPIVAGMLLEAEKVIAGGPGAGWITSEDWVEVVSKVHRPVALALAAKWALPEEVVVTIRDLSDYDTAARQSASNFVRFANAVAKKEGFYVGTIDADDVEALVMIGRSLLDVNDELLSKLTAGLKERVMGQGD